VNDKVIAGFEDKIVVAEVDDVDEIVEGVVVGSVIVTSVGIIDDAVVSIVVVS
jgi:hypothetical protein